MSKILTNSQRKSFFKCPKKWHFENVLKRRPIEDSAALAFGTAFHKFLEEWWTTRNSIISLPVLADGFETKKLQAMARAYAEHWNGQKECFSDVRAELKFEIPVIANERNSAWNYGGKIDAVAEHEGGLWLVEHKTTSQDISLGSDYWSRLEIDGQIEGYIFGYAKSTGTIPAGVIYDVARKPCIKPLRQDKANPETPDEYEERCHAKIMAEPETYLVRRKIYKTANKISDFEKTLYHSARMIDYCVNNSFFPANADGCKGFGTCPYFEVCAGSADISDNYRFTSTDSNPELKEA
jgi:hypothetical protein